MSPSTTLILGAGSSQPYGYPVGSKLRDEILNSDFVTEMLTEALPRVFSSDELTRFRSVFRLSTAASIDFFLSFPCNQEFIPIGKCAIAAALMKCENASLETCDWYDELFRHLVLTNMSSSAAKRVSVITFNYDRSLEYFLQRAARATFNLDYLAGLGWMREKIEILHVFGDLSALPLGNTDDSNSRHYGVNISGHAIQAAADRIQIIDRSNAESAAFATARLMIENSSFICFLGFGFLEENTDRLNLKTIAQSVDFLRGARRIFLSSAMGISHGHVQLLEEQVPADWLFGGYEETVSKFLNRTAFLGWAREPSTTVQRMKERLGDHRRGRVLDAK